MDKKRVVITGINGFVGRHLARELKKQGAFVIGIGHDSSAATDLEGLDEYHSADLTQSWPPIDNVDTIIHLAGLAAVGPSFDNPQKYIQSNSAMITYMGEYSLTQQKKPRILIVSSGAVYDPAQSMPISEDKKVAFASPYVVSKILTENQAEYYHNRGLDTVVVRPFNHIGPGQNLGFIVPDFYDKILHSGPGEVIKVGNITTQRDYTDVRDVVAAYSKLIKADTLKYRLYNVCSGQSISGKDILEKLKMAMNRPDITFQIDQTLVRPTDTMDIFGDASRMKNELDWHPTIDISQTIRDFVAHKNTPR